MRISSHSPIRRTLTLLGLGSILLLLLGCNNDHPCDSSEGSNRLEDVCSTPEPTVEPTPEPTPEPTAQPTIQPTVQPTVTPSPSPEPLYCPPPLIPDAAQQECVMGEIPEAPEPSIFPNDHQAILFYHRPDDNQYDGYRLHTWNDAVCDAYADNSLATSWDDGLPPTGIDPVYGAYWLLDLKENFSACGNFIIHIGTDEAGKDMDGLNWQMPLQQNDPKYARMNFTFTGVAHIFEYPTPTLDGLPLLIQGAAAHWIDTHTLLWNLDTTNVAEVKIHYSENARLAVGEHSVTGNSITFTAAQLNEEQRNLVPHLASWPTFSSDVSETQAKAIAKTQMLAVAYNAEGNAIKVTRVQDAFLLDHLYTRGTQDADEAQLGIDYTPSEIKARLWAPTAQDVKLLVYDDQKQWQHTYPMEEDPATGIWQSTVSTDWDRHFYRYALTVYHPITDSIEQLEATDPYSVNVSTNGRYSQFVNLADADLEPASWETHSIPTIPHPEDAVILEAHIRDFSIRDDSVSEAHRGKYLAFTETDSRPMHYLKSLKDSGVTHFHMLPANDIATIEEDAAQRIELTSTVDALCARVSDAPVCGVENGSDTLLEVLNRYSPESGDAQALVNSMRSIDGFNWGYDPHHFNAPEGSYATNPEGVSRIIEMRVMNQALHELGLRTVLDVVYNHTSSSGIWDNSVFDKTVPGYYHRLDENSGKILQSTCCENTAPEHRMFHKFVVDSLVVWAKYYKFDGFRFDVMGHLPKQTIVDAREAVRAIDPDTYFYGEGWNWGEVADNRLFVQATQTNLGGTEIGTFNDRPRDEIRNAELFKADGRLDAIDHIRLGLAGTLADFLLKDSQNNFTRGRNFAQSSYADDPADIINYVSKHDNETLWDKLQYGLDSTFTANDRARADVIAASIPLLSQGIPFFQLGVDFMRSKSLDRNSYDAGDWFNFVDFTMSSNNWNVGLPLAQENQASWDQISQLSAQIPRPDASAIQHSHQRFEEFLAIRASSPLFRLTSKNDILARVGFHNIGSQQRQGVIVMSLDDGTGLSDLDPQVDAVMVVINGSRDTINFPVATASNFQLHPLQQQSVDADTASAYFTPGDQTGTFNVPPLTTAVFIKPQGAVQGYGLSATATQGTPEAAPYGGTTVFLRGDWNSWSTDTPFTFTGNSAYLATADLAANTPYTFKIADQNWGEEGVNFGAANEDAQITEGENTTLSASNTNLSFTPTLTGTYEFRLNAGNTDAPILQVTNEEPFPGTQVYLRGDMNNWGADQPFSYQGKRIYTLATQLDAGSYAFKIASENWSTVNFGAINEAGASINPGDEIALATGNTNLALTISTADRYVFVLDLNAEGAPKLRLFPEAFFGDNDVFIRGTMNDWGVSNALPYAGNGIYQTSLYLNAGTIQFKIASEDWSSVNLGAPNEAAAILALDQPATLAKTNTNLSFTVETAGSYQFTVEGPDAFSPTVTLQRQ